MKLASIEDVRHIIRFQENDETDTLISAALLAATSYLQTALRNESFEQGSSYDLFYIEHHQVASGVYHYNWRLSRGFIDSLQTFTVKVAENISDFGDSSKEEDITGDCLVNYAKGTVSCLDGVSSQSSISGGGVGQIPGKYVRIDYTAGFTSEDGECFDGVPTWLRDLACYRAVVQMDMVSPELRHDEDSKSKSKPLQSLLESMMATRIRYFPGFQDPVGKTFQ